VLIRAHEPVAGRFRPTQDRGDLEADRHPRRRDRAEAGPRIFRPDLERLASVDLLARIEDAFDGGVRRRRVPVHLPQVEDEEEAEPHRMAVHLESGIPIRFTNPRAVPPDGRVSSMRTYGLRAAVVLSTRWAWTDPFSFSLSRIRAA